MHLVMDVIFADSLEFTLSQREIVECGISYSMQEHWQHRCEAAGIELIDYDTGVESPHQNRDFCDIKIVGARWVARELAIPRSR